MPQRFCFMIMPFGKKPTQAEAGKGVAEIDFNALWDRAYTPVIKALGYEPVRADQDTGALIINQMMQRLYFADLVLAEMTIPNGNVYYEVGIRHASKERGCVLLAADWSKQLFDAAQFRTVRYPLAEGAITDATAAAIAAAIKDPIQQLADGMSPMYDSVKGYPLAVDPAAASVMRDQMAELASFQGEIRAVRALPLALRMARAKQLVETYWRPSVTPLTALTLVRTLRDCCVNPGDWSWLIDFIGKLPSDVAIQQEVREINAFAASNAGKPLDAVAQLEGLIALSGPSPERLGLLGGRYKRLFKNAPAPEDQLFYLKKSIESYERGMELDLNQYYCSGNLPRLYRARGRPGDEERAKSVATIVLAACEIARKRNLPDEWLRSTLLGAAFDDRNCDKAQELAGEVAEEGAALWKIKSTLDDLKLSVSQAQDPNCKQRLTAILADLQRGSGG